VLPVHRMQVREQVEGQEWALPGAGAAPEGVSLGRWWERKTWRLDTRRQLRRLFPRHRLTCQVETVGGPCTGFMAAHTIRLGSLMGEVTCPTGEQILVLPRQLPPLGAPVGRLATRTTTCIMTRIVRWNQWLQLRC